PTPEFYPLSLHDALPILPEALPGSTLRGRVSQARSPVVRCSTNDGRWSYQFTRNRSSLIDQIRRQALSPKMAKASFLNKPTLLRSEEHTSELQSLAYLVC